MRRKTRTETAITLREGDVIVDPKGKQHRITRLDKLPHNVVSFATNTGITVTHDWEKARRCEYDVLR